MQTSSSNHNAGVLKNILFSLLAFVLFFSIIEFSLRGVYFFKEGKEVFYTRWFQWGGLTGWHEPKGEAVNALGFHNPPVSAIKPKNTYRILVLGSSAVYGTDDLDSTWTSKLEKMLNQNSKIKYEVLNGGIPGGSSHEDVTQIRKSIEIGPDLVIVYNGFNDIYAAHYSIAGYLKRRPKYGAEGDFVELKGFLFRHLFFLSLAKHLVNEFREEMRKKQAVPPAPAPAVEKKAEPPVQPEPGKKILNIWNENYVADIKGDPVNVKTFGENYRNNLKEIKRILDRRGIPMMVILQPNLAYSAVKNSISPAAKEILKNSTNILTDDWLRASAIFYPEALSVIEELKSKGWMAYEFTQIFYGMEDQAFVDAVHQVEGYPKQVIAEKVLFLMTANKLVPAPKS